MSQYISVSERRFREGKGHRFMLDGTTVRCQSVTKTYLDQIRELNEDPEISSEDVWPDGQCSKKAVAGKYLCEFHGGKTPGSLKNPMKMFMPIDLAEKLEILSQNPDYLSRQSEIMQLLARNAQLYERLGSPLLHSDIRAKLEEVLAAVQTNDLLVAIQILRKVLEDTPYDEDRVYDELRQNLTLLKGMTTTQVSTAKELRLMASADSVTQMMLQIYDSINRNAQKYIHDQRQQDLFLLATAGDFRKLTGTGASGFSLASGDISSGEE